MIALYPVVTEIEACINVLHVKQLVYIRMGMPIATSAACEVKPKITLHAVHYTTGLTDLLSLS